MSIWAEKPHLHGSLCHLGLAMGSRTGRYRTARLAENVERVQAVVNENPELPVRDRMCHSVGADGVSRKFERRTLKLNSVLHPYLTIFR